MDKEKISIEQYILNESFQNFVLKKSENDTKYWEEYIKTNPRLESEINYAVQILTFIATRKKLPRNKAISEEVFNKLQQRIAMEQASQEKPRKVLLNPLLKYAALLVMVLGIGYLLNTLVFKRVDYSSEFLEVIVPQGERSQIVLPDGTKVWLNSGTVFKYPVNFLKNDRKVYLQGEAFFDVKHDHNKTFSVELPQDLVIKVLGTEFNVKCYPGEKTIETTLVKGSIHLTNKKVRDEINLKPNQKATYYAMSRKIEVSPVIDSQNQEKQTDISENKSIKNKAADLGLITAWKEDALAFKDLPFEEIAVLLERWYGMKISIVDEGLKKEKFTGKFANKETIFQILEIFDRSEPIHYTVNNKEIIIDKKRKN